MRLGAHPCLRGRLPRRTARPRHRRPGRVHGMTTRPARPGRTPGPAVVRPIGTGRPPVTPPATPNRSVHFRRSNRGSRTGSNLDEPAPQRTLIRATLRRFRPDARPGIREPPCAQGGRSLHYRADVSITWRCRRAGRTSQVIATCPQGREMDHLAFHLAVRQDDHRAHQRSEQR